jgi:hypothetical protein
MYIKKKLKIFEQENKNFNKIPHFKPMNVGHMWVAERAKLVSHSSTGYLIALVVH